MAFPIPSMLLKQLYTRDSLSNTPEGVRFSLKNRLSDAVVTKLIWVKIDDQQLPAAGVTVDLGDGTPVSYTHLRAHETVLDLVCRLLLEKTKQYYFTYHIKSLT